MKILLLSWEYPPVMVGGLGRHVHHIATELTALGHEVVVISRDLESTDPAPPSIRYDQGVKVIGVHEDPILLNFSEDLVAWVLGLGFALTRSALTCLDDWVPDIIHAHDWIVAHCAITLADHYQCTLITTVHATEAGRHNGWVSGVINRQIHSIEWWLFQRSDLVITCSNSMFNEAAELFASDNDEDAEKIVVIPNGIDHDQWLNSLNPLQQKSFRDINPPRLLFVGRLEYEKGVHDIIEALPAIRQIIPGVSLDIVGAGTNLKQLTELAEKNNTSNDIRFLGSYSPEQLRKELDTAAAIILPSHYEPCGIIALESAARGIPLIVADTGGLAEFVAGAGNKSEEAVKIGNTFRSGDPQDLAKVTVTALKNYDQTLSYAATAYQKVSQTMYSWRTIATNVLETYQLAIKTHNKIDKKPILSKPEFGKRVFSSDQK